MKPIRFEIRAGGQQAACPGTAPFLVSGGSPVGGYWTGPFIDSAGIFDPSTVGSYIVTYHAPNGCFGDKKIQQIYAGKSFVSFSFL